MYLPLSLILEFLFSLLSFRLNEIVLLQWCFFSQHFWIFRWQYTLAGLAHKHWNLCPFSQKQLSTSPYYSSVLSWACFKILFNVPFAISSDILCTAMETKPLFTLCLYCRWLPFCLTKYQPSFSISSIISRTFIIINPSFYIKITHFLNNSCRFFYQFTNSSRFFSVFCPEDVAPSPCA